MTSDTDQPPQHAPSMLRRTLFAVVLVVLFLGAGVFGFKRLASLAEDSRRSPSAPPPAMVRTRVAKSTTYVEIISGFGRARALRETTVSAETAGIVVRVDPRLEAGQAYAYPTPNTASVGTSATPRPARDESGPVVIQVETAELDDLVARAEAETKGTRADIVRLKDTELSLGARISLARSGLTTAMRERDRIQKLVEDGRKFSPSALDVEHLKVLLREQTIKQLEQSVADARNQQLILAERLEVHRRDIAIAERNVQRAGIRMPFPGVIQARQVHVGDRVAPGTALFTVLDMQIVEVPIALPARTFDDVKPGARVVLRSAETNAVVHTGRVARKAPRIDDAERTYFIYVQVKGTPTTHTIAPGTFLRAEVTGRSHPSVIVVSREAFVGRDLFRVDAADDAGEHPDEDPGVSRTARQGLARRITPTVRRWLPDVAIVTAGLKAGDEFIITNLESVGNGARVRVAAPSGDDAPGIHDR